MEDRADLSMLVTDFIGMVEDIGKQEVEFTVDAALHNAGVSIEKEPAKGPTMTTHTMTTDSTPSPDFKCSKCDWKGPAIELDGAAENECPECGGKCRPKT